MFSLVKLQLMYIWFFYTLPRARGVPFPPQGRFIYDKSIAGEVGLLNVPSSEIPEAFDIFFNFAKKEIKNGLGLVLQVLKVLQCC